MGPKAPWEDGDRVIRRTAGVDLATVAVVTVGVLLGGWWWAAGATLWLLLFSAAVLTLPSPPRLGPRARSSAALTVLVGVPLGLALALVAARRGRTGVAAGVQIGGVVAVGLAVAWAALLTAGRLAARAGDIPATGRKAWRPARIVGAAALLAVPPVAVPLGIDHLLVARLADRVRHCPALARFADGDAPRALRHELAGACDLQKGGDPQASQKAGDVDVAVYTGGPDPHPEVMEVAISAVVFHRELLGRPAGTAVAVLPVGLSGNTRGMAGPGYVIIDRAELAAPGECGSFRRTAGVQGRCGAWVLAHELGHQWFRWTAYERATEALPAVIEGTADYLAFSWWRSTYGAADAERLAVDLFEGRLALARGFATTHVPARPPGGMTDAEGRALVYGRASAAWIAAERVAGEPAAVRALRAVHEAGRGADPSIPEILAAVAAVAPGVAPVLEQWWLDPGFEPRLPAR